MATMSDENLMNSGRSICSCSIWRSSARRLCFSCSLAFCCCLTRSPVERTRACREDPASATITWSWWEQLSSFHTFIESDFHCGDFRLNVSTSHSHSAVGILHFRLMKIFLSPDHHSLYNGHKRFYCDLHRRLATISNRPTSNLTETIRWSPKWSSSPVIFTGNFSSLVRFGWFSKLKVKMHREKNVLEKEETRSKAMLATR